MNVKTISLKALPLMGRMSRSPCPPGMASDRGAIRTCSWWGGVSGKTPPFIDVHPTPALPIEGREKR
jgi:hypothetical protein